MSKMVSLDDITDEIKGVTPEELAAIRERTKYLYEGPLETKWRVGTLGVVTVSALRKPNKLNITINRPGYGNVPPEGEFFANAQKDILALLDEIDHLQTGIRMLLEEIEQLQEKERGLEAVVEQAKNLLVEASDLADLIGDLEDEDERVE